MEELNQAYVLGYADDSEFYIPDALHVMRNDDEFLCEDDVEVAKIAEQDGVKLIYGMEHVPDGVYVDTLENRTAIINGLEKYPEYKDVPVYGHILDSDAPSPDEGKYFGKGGRL